MRRILCCLTLAAFLCVPVQAAQPREYIALTFDQCEKPLLEVLEKHGARATFLLPEQALTEENLRLLVSGKHEVGLRFSDEAALNAMSRRQIAALLSGLRQRLPEKASLVWLQLSQTAGDGLLQVSRAMKLSFLGFSLDRTALPDHVRRGDVVALADISPAELERLLSILEHRGLRMVTASELAGAADVHLIPGRTYAKFPEQPAGEAFCPIETLPHRSWWGSLRLSKNRSLRTVPLMRCDP